MARSWDVLSVLVDRAKGRRNPVADPASQASSQVDRVLPRTRFPVERNKGNPMTWLLPLALVLSGSSAPVAGGSGLTTRIVELDPATAEVRPLADVDLMFAEFGRHLPPVGRLSVADQHDDTWWLRAPKLHRARSAQSGACEFRSQFGASQWAETEGYLVVFKPGFVPRTVISNSCHVGEILLTRGATVRVELRAPEDVTSMHLGDCTVHYEVPHPEFQHGLGVVPMSLEWSEVAGGGRRATLECAGIEPGGRALVTFPGFDPIEIATEGPARQTLVPSRHTRLRVCDWETGEPIGGVQLVLRFGRLSTDGRFVTDRPRGIHFGARPRNPLQGPLTSEQGELDLASSELFLPGETAAQITNLRHDEFEPSIYLAQRGPASRSPLVVLASGTGQRDCRLFLRRVRRLE